MPDLLYIGVILGGTIVLSLLAVIVMNWFGKRPDPMQDVLEREPMFGKDFHAKYYSDLPRNVVVEVRTEFARVLGVPADFTRPEDNLTQFGPRGGDEALRESIKSLFPYTADAADISGSTLDSYIRATVAIFLAQQRYVPETAAIDKE